LFHSEFVHGSPQTDSLKSRRLSYDVRAAARCFDDNTSYRRNFSSLNNFITLKKNDSVEKARRVMFQVSKEIELEHYLKNPKQDIPVQFFVNQLSEEKNIDAERFELYLKVYDLFPFAEDRYLQLTKEAHNLSHKLGEKFLEKTLKQSKSFFWSFCCGETAREWGAKGIAKKAFKKAIQLAKKTKLEFLGHPIEYDATRGGHCLQILPDQVKQQAKEKLHNL